MNKLKYAIPLVIAILAGIFVPPVLQPVWATLFYLGVVFTPIGVEISILVGEGVFKPPIYFVAFIFIAIGGVFLAASYSGGG